MNARPTELAKELRNGHLARARLPMRVREWRVLGSATWGWRKVPHIVEAILTLVRSSQAWWKRRSPTKSRQALGDS
jgi:hypothetical protein